MRPTGSAPGGRGNADEYQAFVFNFARTWESIYLNFDLDAPPCRQFPGRLSRNFCMRLFRLRIARPRAHFGRVWPVRNCKASHQAFIHNWQSPGCQRRRLLHCCIVAGHLPAIHQAQPLIWRSSRSGASARAHSDRASRWDALAHCSKHRMAQALADRPAASASTSIRRFKFAGIRT
jgi:hypothetical protein